MKKVFLEDLPRMGGVKSKFDWKNSIGYNVKFIYENIEGEVEIIKYTSKDQILTIQYNNKEFGIATDSFIKCALGKLLGKITDEFKIEIGQVINEVEIIDRKVILNKKGQNYKRYKYKCGKCGFDGNMKYYKDGKLYSDGYWIVEGSLLRGCGCVCCANQIVVYGINSIHDTAPWMIGLGVDFEEAKKFNKSSGKKIKCVCPHCDNVSHKIGYQVYTCKSIGCNCRDWISYPEKFMCSMLKQLGIRFETQLTKTTFEWIDKYKYDFYIPSLSMIIETHGMQHYKSSSRGRNLEEEQINDKNKKELSLVNGIKTYIELDCRKSDLDWIKNSILNSELNSIFNLSNIDWLECEEYAIKSNLVKEVCDYWNNKEEWETTTDLAKVFGVSKYPILKYLNMGVRLGWCNYDGKEQLKISGGRNGKLKGKKVEVFKDGISLGIFESVSELERQSEKLFGVKLLYGNISSVCRNKRKHHKGYRFEYI